MIPAGLQSGDSITDGFRSGTVKHVLRDSGQILVDWSDGTKSIVLEEDFFLAKPSGSAES